MKRASRIAIGVAASLALGLAVAAALAHPGGMGPGMMQGMGSGGMADHRGPMGGPMHGPMGGPMGGPMTGGMQHDDASFADMRLVHDLLMSHDRIKRTVTNLPDGIRTVTESEDPHVAQAIKAHVASMEQRLKDGREFNMFSTTLPVLFEKKDRIKTIVATTEKGSIVTQTSSDSTAVAALQAHAVEVSELARDGMIAMMRSAKAGMGTIPRGPGAGMRRNTSPAPQPPAANEHVH